MADNLQYKDCPHDVQYLEDDEETVEDVVAREHVNMTLNSVHRGPEDPDGEHVAPHDHPGQGEQPEHHLGQLVPLGVLTELGQLQQRIGAVVDDEDEGANPGEVTGPGEHHQQYRHVVMDKVLEEIFPLDIHPLGDGEGAVEAEL